MGHNHDVAGSSPSQTTTLKRLNFNPFKGLRSRRFSFPVRFFPINIRHRQLLRMANAAGTAAAGKQRVAVCIGKELVCLAHVGNALAIRIVKDEAPQIEDVTGILRCGFRKAGWDP